MFQLHVTYCVCKIFQSILDDIFIYTLNILQQQVQKFRFLIIIINEKLLSKY
jgi:hypothetical protein